MEDSCVQEKNGKTKILLEVLQKVSVEFPETKQFTEEHLKQKCLKENISVKEVIYFFYKRRSK